MEKKNIVKAFLSAKQLALSYSEQVDRDAVELTESFDRFLKNIGHYHHRKSVINLRLIFHGGMLLASTNGSETLFYYSRENMADENEKCSVARSHGSDVFRTLQLARPVLDNPVYKKVIDVCLAHGIREEKVYKLFTQHLKAVPSEDDVFVEYVPAMRAVAGLAMTVDYGRYSSTLGAQLFVISTYDKCNILVEHLIFWDEEFVRHLKPNTRKCQKLLPFLTDEKAFLVYQRYCEEGWTNDRMDDEVFMASLACI